VYGGSDANAPIFLRSWFGDRITVRPIAIPAMKPPMCAKLSIAGRRPRTKEITISNNRKMRSLPGVARSCQV